MSAIIVLTIGPVQSYISQARRTQDLWQGSRILSYLASVGVDHAMKQPGAEVIYPFIEQGQTDNIPNRMVVRWPGDESGARECAVSMENAIRFAWQAVSRDTMEYFLDTATGTMTTARRIWQAQEESWLECYWVVTPETGAYSDDLRLASNAMSARKLLRTFPQIDEGGRKCSITGEHEALHAEGDYVGFWNARKAETRNLALLGKHERLSAISTIKRFAHETNAGNGALKFPNRFPSTSSIAAATFKYDVLQALDRSDEDAKDLQGKLKAFIQALKELFAKVSDLFFTRNGKINTEYFGLIERAISPVVFESEIVQQFRSVDGDFLFEDTLISKTIEEYSGQIPDPKKLVIAQKALSDLLKAASTLNIPRPNPYLVILSMDGDHMGKTLGTLGENQHRIFSEALANFAREDVPRIVEHEHLGRVVYAGGDDVLALLPVRDALKVAEDLRSGFEKAVAALGIRNHEGEQVTASTGLAYVHHTHSLQDAVGAANSAQGTAKKEYKRNALGVEFLRRSGEPRSMGHKWQSNGRATVDYISDFVEEFSSSLARSLPYEVARIDYSMGENVPNEAVRLELERVLRRRLDTPDKDQRKKKARELCNEIMALKAGYPWKNVQFWLELARFIAQTVDAGDS